jgi:hypothetical protein
MPPPSPGYSRAMRFLLQQRPIHRSASHSEMVPRARARNPPRRHPGTPHIPRLSRGRHRRIWLFEHEQESGEAISQTQAFTETEPRINGSTDLRLELSSKMLAEVLALPDLAQNPKLWCVVHPLGHFYIARREDCSITSRTEKPPYEARAKARALC